MSNQVQALIFDLDGVITDTAEYHFLAWKALAEELGISFDRDFNEELKGVSRMDSIARILKYGNKENDFSETEIIALADKKNLHYQELILEITPSDTLPGIKDFVAAAKERGLKLGLASASKNAFTVMDALEMTAEFDVIVDAAKIKNSKPDPEVFLEAARQLDVAPSSCIGIEDAAAGVDSIKDAGMFAVGVGSKDALAKADIVYEKTSDLDLPTIIKLFEQKA